MAMVVTVAAKSLTKVPVCVLRPSKGQPALKSAALPYDGVW